ncbi:MAG: hypothetical protein LBQ90_02655 [Synergistaceae bacterium]|jgi:hypothetical protein|nr:hypothetical protein [Synergistaceae bacterium]
MNEKHMGEKHMDEEYMNEEHINEGPVNEEQDVASGIRNTSVDGASVVQRMAHILFTELYPSKKFRLGRYDFAYDQYIDETRVGSGKGGRIRLRFMTTAGEHYRAPEQNLTLMSHAGNEAIVRLSDEIPCFEELEQAAKIRRYVSQRDVSQLPESVQGILRGRERQAQALEERAGEHIERAIQNADFYVHGAKIEIKHGSAMEKLDFVLGRLIESVFDRLNMVNAFVESDADILRILDGEQEAAGAQGRFLNNDDALDEIARWLESRSRSRMPTSMGDVQRRYGDVPYGWREIDIAALVARLIAGQKISVGYGGAIVARDDRRLVEYLRGKAADRVVITRRIAPPEDLTRRSVAFLRDCFGAMDIPADADGLVHFVLRFFGGKAAHYGNLVENEYARARYPQKETVTAAYRLMNDILSRRGDDIALLNRLMQRQGDLKDSARDMEEVETFFETQKSVFDAALKLQNSLQDEQDYFATDADISGKIAEISSILGSPKPYDRIDDLTGLMQAVRTAYDELLAQKKDEVQGIVTQCMGDVHTLAGSRNFLRGAVTKADDHFTKKKEEVLAAASLTVLDAMIPRLLGFRDTVCRRIEAMMQNASAQGGDKGEPATRRKIATVRRYEIFPARRLQSREDIDQYIDGIRRKLYATLEGNEGIQIN